MCSKKVTVPLCSTNDEIIIRLPHERVKRKPSYQEIEDELFQMLEDTINEKDINIINPEKRKKISKNKTISNEMDIMNYQNKWLFQDGKKAFKNEFNQTCYKYICTYSLPNGTICGKDSYVKKDDISHKQFCKYHRKN